MTELEKKAAKERLALHAAQQLLREQMDATGATGNAESMGIRRSITGPEAWGEDGQESLEMMSEVGVESEQRMVGPPPSYIRIELLLDEPDVSASNGSSGSRKVRIWAKADFGLISGRNEMNPESAKARIATRGEYKKSSSELDNWKQQKKHKFSTILSNV